MNSNLFRSIYANSVSTLNLQINTEQAPLKFNGFQEENIKYLWNWSNDVVFIFRLRFSILILRNAFEMSSIFHSPGFFFPFEIVLFVGNILVHKTQNIRKNQRLHCLSHISFFLIYFDYYYNQFQLFFFSFRLVHAFHSLSLSISFSFLFLPYLRFSSMNATLWFWLPANRIEKLNCFSPVKNARVKKCKRRRRSSLLVYENLFVWMRLHLYAK